MKPRAPAERAGALIAEQLADRVMPGQVDQRHRLVEAAIGRKRSSRLRVSLGAAAVAIAVAGVFFAWSRQRAQDPVTFYVGESAQHGQLDERIAPGGEASLPIRFSDGSSLDLDPGARARVTGVTERGAVVLLEAGKARVDINPRENAQWKVLAGPYVVHVHGTSFDVRYEEPRDRLRIRMLSGAIQVFGPGFDAGVRVEGTEQWEHCSRCEKEESPQPTTPEPVPTLPDAHAPSSAHAHGPVDRNLSVPALSLSAAPAVTADWRTLLREGKRAEALRVAEQAGLDSVLASATADEHMALADAGRFEDNTRLANVVLSSLRSRFPASPQAASAAFLLGRMSESSSPDTAISWYTVYAREAPAGPLVAEAMGRRMILLERVGNSKAAQQAASQYLRRYPTGPYAGVARRVAQP